MLKSRHSGMAVALVLWLIFGMALTVTAIIHFSRGDTEAVEFAIQRSQANAAGRGAALLVLRDKALTAREAAKPTGDADSDQKASGNAEEGPFAREYVLGGVVVQATVTAGNTLVSLNDASPEILTTLFLEVGKAPSGLAESLTQAVVDYRSQSSAVSFDTMYHPGFRFREELLVLGGMTRAVYDRVRPWVHAFHTGDLDASSASGVLAQAFDAEEETSRSSGSTSSSDGAVASPSASGAGLLTFDSIYDENGASGVAPTLVIVESQFEDGSRFRQMIWVDEGTWRIVSAIAPVKVSDKY